MTLHVKSPPPGHSLAPPRPLLPPHASPPTTPRGRDKPPQAPVFRAPPPPPGIRTQSKGAGLNLGRRERTKQRKEDEDVDMGVERGGGSGTQGRKRPPPYAEDPLIMLQAQAERMKENQKSFLWLTWMLLLTSGFLHHI